MDTLKVFSSSILIISPVSSTLTTSDFVSVTGTWMIFPVPVGLFLMASLILLSIMVLLTATVTTDWPPSVVFVSMPAFCSMPLTIIITEPWLGCEGVVVPLPPPESPLGAT